jgi:hypothetical protein
MRSRSGGGVSSAWSFIGRSLFSADAWLNATIDEFRIYDGRLTPEEIATGYKFGPDALALPGTLVQSNAATGLTLSWPSWMAGFVLETTPALGASLDAGGPVSDARQRPMAAHVVHDQRPGVSTACGDENGVRADTHDQLAALRAGSATVTIRFIPAETGCSKVLGHSHFGDSFTQNGVDFLR